MPFFTENLEIERSHIEYVYDVRWNHVRARMTA